VPEVHSVDILLVEDSLQDIELALHALRREKLANHIEICRDGEEALDFLFCRERHSERKFHVPPRLVLLDLKLPKVDGLEVLRQTKGDPRTKAIPIVIMTSSREERDMAKGYKLGVNAYIQKPINFEEFRQIVNQIGLFWMVINRSPPSTAFSTE
jgi:two-component system, response regulator